jgi:hypothetical protein
MSVLKLRASDLETRRALLRPYGAGLLPDRYHRAYALGYCLAPLTGLRAVQGTTTTRRGEVGIEAQTRVQNVEAPVSALTRGATLWRR